MRALTLLRTKSIAARCVLCLVSGAIYAAAFAPWSAHLWGLTALLLGLGLIVSAQRPAQAAFFGFLFALAAFTIGLEWSVRSMHEFGRLPFAQGASMDRTCAHAYSCRMASRSWGTGLWLADAGFGHTRHAMGIVSSIGRADGGNVCAFAFADWSGRFDDVSFQCYSPQAFGGL